MLMIQLAIKCLQQHVSNEKLSLIVASMLLFSTALHPLYLLQLLNVMYIHQGKTPVPALDAHMHHTGPYGYPLVVIRQFVGRYDVIICQPY